MLKCTTRTFVKISYKNLRGGQCLSCAKIPLHPALFRAGKYCRIFGGEEGAVFVLLRFRQWEFCFCFPELTCSWRGFPEQSLSRIIVSQVALWLHKSRNNNNNNNNLHNEIVQDGTGRQKEKADELRAGL